MHKGFEKAFKKLKRVWGVLLLLAPASAWGLALECGVTGGPGSTCNVYLGYYTSVQGTCQLDNSCKPVNFGTKLSTCNDRCLWHRSSYATETPTGVSCPLGTCNCGLIAFGGYTSATCIASGSGGTCGTGSGIVGQMCDDSFSCVSTSSTAFDALGCSAGLKCTCDPQQKMNQFGQWNPTCQPDASCSTPTPAPTVSAGAVTFSPNSFDFGTITVGQNVKKTITISNTTSTSYNNCVLFSTEPDIFIISGASACGTLNAGGSCNFTLTVAPATTSQYNAWLSVCCGSSGVNCPLIAQMSPLKKIQNKVTESLYSGSKATLKWLESNLLQSAGACTVPVCPASNHCDCLGLNWQTCGFSSQQACYCIVGYNPAVNCPAPPPASTMPSLNANSGQFKVAGAASGAAVCFAGYSCGPCPAGDVCVYDPTGNCCVNQTQQYCLASWSTCKAPVTPTPTATPAGTPVTNCYASGGVGRKCGADADCCSGLKCMIAGAQPVSQHPACASGDPGCTNGVNYYVNFATNFDWMESNLPRPMEPGGSNGPQLRTSGPLKICVNPSGGKYPVPTPYATPSQLIPQGSGHDPAALVWDGSFGFRCKLSASDKNRNADPKVCGCKSGYEPALILPSEFSSIASNHPLRQKREVLWSLLMRTLQSSVEGRHALKQKKVLPEARAALPGSCPQNTCGSVTCPSGGSKVYFPYTQDLTQFQLYASGKGTTTAASSSTCKVPWNGSTTKEQSLLVVCSTFNPATAPAYFAACDANSSLGAPFWAGLQPASWICGMDMSTTCGATPTPSPTATPGKGGSGTCNNGDVCTNGTLYGLWDAPNLTCCGGTPPNQMCIGGTITCYAPSPTPTATPVSSPSASATPIAGTPVDLYAEGFTLYGTTAKNWGYNGAGQAIGASGALATNSMMVACVRTCPGTVPRKTSPSGLYCDCAAADPTKPIYDPVNNICLAVAFEDAQMDATGNWVCPPGYDWVPNSTNPARKCRPKLPSNEFTRNADGYPVCTGGSSIGARIPVQFGASSISAGNYSGSELPLYSATSTWMGGFNNYKYAKPVGTTPNEYPFYLYTDQTHCYCANAVLKSPPLASVASAGAIARITGAAPDTYDVISKQTGGFPDSVYGMVAVHKNPSLDGRLGTEFAAANSVCACPNVNEVPVAVSATEPRLGVVCAPPASLKTDANRVFTQFDPVKDATYVINSANEPKDASGNIQKEISLPASMAAPNSMVKYVRRIHKCQIGYIFDKTNLKCVWDASAHQCDSTSPLPSKTKENQSFPSWSQIVNKRVACCTNDMDANTISSSVKFDCVDNTAVAKTATFNELWAADPTTLGGQINAVVLSTGNYQPLTGWYTQDGRRCGEFSEFSTTPIIPGTVPPFVTAGQQETTATSWVATGSAIPMPSGPAFDDILAKLGNRAKVPNPSLGTAIELNHARRCPLLVRAALITRCPGNPPAGTNAPRFTVKDASNITRCPSADTAQVHIRVEQVFRIAGEPLMLPVDTILDQKSSSTINVGDVIRTKNGGKCLPGMQSSGSICKY